MNEVEEAIDQSIKHLLRNRIAMTIQNTMAVLGPLPDETGDWIRALIREADICKIPALGCYLEECEKAKSYAPLRNAMWEIPGENHP